MRGKPPLMTPFFDGANIVTDPSWIRWFMGDDSYTEISAEYLDSGRIILAGIADAGALAAQDTVDWTTDIDNIPDGINTPAPTIAGLYLTSSYLGYYDGTSPYNASGWKAFISSTGDFGFDGDANNYISWDGNTLEIAGDIVIKGGSGIGNLTDAGALAGLDDITLAYVTDAGGLASLSSFGTENFVRNGDFSVWDSGTTSAPDAWTLTSGAGASITRSTTCAFGLYSAAITNGDENEAVFYNAPYEIYGIEYFAGKSFILGAKVRASNANRVRIRIYTDGASPASAYSSYHTGGSTFEWLYTASITVPADATYLRVALIIDAGTVITAYIDGVVCIEGSYITDKFLMNGVSRPRGTGCMATPTYIGYVSAGVPTSYFKSDGTFRFYKDSNNYFLYDGTSLEYRTNEAGKFRIANGGDIQLCGSDGSNPGSLDLHVTTDASGYYGSLYGVTTGNWIYFLPQGSGVDGNLSFVMGNSSYTWKQIVLEALDITLDASNDIELNTPLVRPESNGGTDIGNNKYWFGRVECVSLDDSHDISYLDDKDDLGDMMKVGPKVDEKGSPVIDAKTGNQIVDDKTLPDYVCTKVDGVIHMRGDRTHGPNAAFHGWLLGGIKQLKRESDARYDEILRRLEALENGRTEDVT